MIDNHPFVGATNLDDPDHVIPPGFHREARNLIFRGSRGNMRGESFPGTTEIVNSLLPASGVNKTIGSYYDPVNQQIIFFNYNSLGTHGIYIYTTATGVFQVLILIGSGTDGDILGFTPDLITSINIFYNDVSDGNLLFYVDTLGRPTCFNIQRYINTPYTLIKRAYIDLAKAPPVMPVQCCYENDYTANVNNLINSLFQFKYRYVYDDFQKSVLSTGSRVPLPNQPFDQISDADPTQSSRIALYVSTGDVDVKKIEIWGQSFTDNGGKSNYFLIISLDKAQLNIASNDVYRWIFKNDGTYLPGDPQATTQLQDWVPQKAISMELLNGNVAAFAGVTEGYDRVDLGLNVTKVEQVVPPSEISAFLYFGYEGSDDSGGPATVLNLVVTGAGQNDPNGNPTSVPLFVGKLYISLTAADGTDLSFFVEVDGAHGDDHISAIMSLLITAATGKGFAVVSQAPNILTLSYSGGYFLGGTYFINELPFSEFEPVNEVCFAYADLSAQQFGIQYFDDKGRTNGTSLPVISTCQTLYDNTGNTINKITISITSRPPIWAKYYDLVRPSNLTYNKRLFWISNQTFTDVDLNTNVKYAYLGISYMADYDRDIEAATPVVSYDFTPGDRVRFQQRFDMNSVANNLPTGLDYEITSVATNPIINGIVQNGSFLKIVYPTDAITPTFDFGGPNNQWYEMLIYNYRKSIQDTAEQTFFEFARRYAIGNAGTANAFHLGQTQNQSADLTNPAIITTSDGDYFYKFRNVPVGSIYDCSVGTIRYSDQFASMPIAIPQSPITNAKYTIQSSSFTSTDTDNFTFADTTHFFFWNQSSLPITIRLEDQYQLYCEQPLTHWMFVDLVNATTAQRVYLVQNFPLSVTAGQGQSYTTQYDKYVQVPANTKVFLISQGRSIDPAGVLVVQGSSLRFSIVDNIKIPVIESSFSDNYQIVTNSNSRPSVYDENAKQQFDGAFYRWSLADQFNTSINQTNTFYFQNFDRVDSTYGDIVRLRSRKRELRIFQERRCGRTGIYSKFIQSNDGDSNLVTTDSIITSNNINYYEGEFGIGNQGASLCSAGFSDYFIDPVKGFAVRVSVNGLEPISEQNKVQTWAGENFPNYLNNYSYQYGGNAAILGVIFFCDDRPSETWFCLQGGNNGSTSIVEESFVFREEGNLWTSFMDFAPDSVVCAENQLISFKAGKMYNHTNTDQYCNYYGVQNKPSITIVKNDHPLVKKTWESVAQVANVIWNSPLIYTELISYGTQRQESNLVDTDFAQLEGQFHAPLLRDIWSIGGVGNGNVLKGTFMVIKLQPTDGSKFSYIAQAAIKYNVSPVLMK